MQSASRRRWALARTEHGILTIGIVPFLLLQLSVLLVFTTHFSWAGVAVCALSYAVRMFAITGFYHRYFSHQTYAMNRFWQFFAAFLGTTATQKGPLWWAAHHRKHHKESDTPDDPHSSREGFWHSHWLWFLYEANNAVEYERIPDLVRYPELRWLDRFWFLPPVMLGVGLFLWGGWHMAVWGYFVSTFLLSNATYTINSLMHYWGKQQFYTGDESRNHWLLALVTLGEGWHNNHHRYQAATRNGFFWYEFDITYYLLRLLSLIGLVRGLTPVPEKILEEAHFNQELRRQALRQGRAFTPIQVRRQDLQRWRERVDRGLASETVRRVREEMQDLGEQVAERSRKLRAEVQVLSGQLPGSGRLRVELQTLSREMAERGRKLLVEFQALSGQVAERRQLLGSESQRLFAQAQELSREMTERGRQLLQESCSVGEQVAETLRERLAEVQELGEQLIAWSRKLRAELDRLSSSMPELA